MDSKTVELAIMGIIGYGAAISKDVFLEYLKINPEKKVTKPDESCVEHSISIELIEQRLDQHDKELQSGKETFREMQKTLKNIETDMAVLVDRARKHRREDENERK